jgi:hypothetical protein
MAYTSYWFGNDADVMYRIGDLPSSPQNLVVFELSGYNYRTIPAWFDSYGNRLTPLQFSVIHHNLYYRWTFYKSSPLDREYYLSTSDDIMPVVVEKLTRKRMKVTRVSRHNGYTIWKVYE